MKDRQPFDLLSLKSYSNSRRLNKIGGYCSFCMLHPWLQVNLPSIFSQFLFAHKHSSFISVFNINRLLFHCNIVKIVLEWQLCLGRRWQSNPTSLIIFGVLPKVKAALSFPRTYTYLSPSVKVYFIY